MENQQQKIIIPKKASGIGEVFIALLIVFALIAVYVPLHIHQKKLENIDKNYYQNKVISQQITKDTTQEYDYTEFWALYKTLLTQRADTDKNRDISVEEKQIYDDGFFGTLELKIDPVTKVVTTKAGLEANPDSLICRLNSYYPNQAWIQPACSIL